MVQKKEVSKRAYFSTVCGYATGHPGCYVPTGKSKHALSLEEIKKIVRRKEENDGNNR